MRIPSAQFYSPIPLLREMHVPSILRDESHHSQKQIVRRLEVRYREGEPREQWH